MKKFFTIFMIVLMSVACAESKVIDGQTYQPYGIANQEERNPNVQYRISAGNVIWGALLIETVIAPILLWGWALYEPVAKK